MCARATELEIWEYREENLLLFMMSSDRPYLIIQESSARMNEHEKSHLVNIFCCTVVAKEFSRNGASKNGRHEGKISRSAVTESKAKDVQTSVES